MGASFGEEGCVGKSEAEVVFGLEGGLAYGVGLESEGLIVGCVWWYPFSQFI
jgi:hypothetical protein